MLDANAVAARLPTMRKEIILSLIGADLRRHPALHARILHENGFNDAAGENASLKHIAATLGALVAGGVLGKLRQLEWFGNRVERLYARVSLFEIEACSRLLLSRGHSARRLADSLFPVASGKGDAAVAQSETSVIRIMDAALVAAREMSLPSFATILEARRSAAEHRTVKAAPPVPV